LTGVFGFFVGAVPKNPNASLLRGLFDACVDGYEEQVGCRLRDDADDQFARGAAGQRCRERQREDGPPVMQQIPDQLSTRR
jgi:hypothetical protein